MAALVTVQSSRLINKHHIHFSSSLSHSFFTSSSISNPPLTRHISATIITSQSTSSSDPPKPSTGNTNSPPPPLSDSNKPISPGQGFGSPTPVPSTKKGGKRSGAKSVIRRTPVEKPTFLSSAKDEVTAKERAQTETAFILVWLGLGAIILTEGIILSASGFLPEKWDKFFVKYLYPSFTPTVGLFFAGTIVYGVAKYLENENSKTTQK